MITEKDSKSVGPEEELQRLTCHEEVSLIFDYPDTFSIPLFP